MIISTDPVHIILLALFVMMAVYTGMVLACITTAGLHMHSPQAAEGTG